jgi:hypothetical protein
MLPDGQSDNGELDAAALQQRMALSRQALPLLPALAFQPRSALGFLQKALRDGVHLHGAADAGVKVAVKEVIQDAPPVSRHRFVSQDFHLAAEFLPLARLVVSELALPLVRLVLQQVQ